MTDKPRSWRWRSKLFVLLAMFAVVPAGTLTWIVLDVAKASFVRSTMSSLEAIAAAKASAIEQLTSDRRRDVERIATLVAPKLDDVLAAEIEVQELPEVPEPTEPLPQLQDAGDGRPPEPEEDDDGEVEGENEEALAPTAEPSAPTPRQARLTEDHRESIRRLRRHLNLVLWDRSEFEELLVIDREGRVIASTFSDHEGRSARELEYFQSGQRTTHVQRAFVSPITERLTMVISTPIQSEETEVIGVLAARLNLTSLYRLVNDRTGLGDTGETVVAKIIDDELVFMAPTRHDPNAALERRMSSTDDRRLPILDAARGGDGSGEHEDYRGRRVLAAWQSVPSLEWGLVVKIDESEATEPVGELQLRTIQVSVVVLLLALIASILAARELVRPLRELKEATDKISRGDFDVRIDIRERDEIGDLADSFERMVAAIKFFREHARPEEEDLPEGSSSESDPS